jgi:hypothetical protein
VAEQWVPEYTTQDPLLTSTQMSSRSSSNRRRSRVLVKSHLTESVGDMYNSWWKAIYVET